MKLDNQIILHILMDLLDKYSPDQAPECMKELQDILKENKKEISINDETLLSLILRTLQSKWGNFGPLNAFMGGYVSQEAIKAITNKYMPTNQYMYNDCLEIIKDD